MYIPPVFRVEDAAKLTAFIQRHSFATLITNDAAVPFASHLPMLFRADATGGHGTLVSHMARANPQWEHFASGTEVLAVFHGPHSYISPAWYETEPAVPTWNYQAVHAYGIPRIISEHERVVSLLKETIATYEGGFERPWSGEIPDGFRDRLIKGIVAFEIPITRLEGKFKLGQNRPAGDIQGVIDALSRSGDADGRAIAQAMAKECGAVAANQSS